MSNWNELVDRAVNEYGTKSYIRHDIKPMSDKDFLTMGLLYIALTFMWVVVIAYIVAIFWK